MAKITYVDTIHKIPNHKTPYHISMKKLEEIFGCTSQEIIDNLKKRLGESMWEYGLPFAEGIQCPFGERDLMDDTCYMGSEIHKCKYFKRYVWDGVHSCTIECHCPKPRIVPEKGKPIQLSLFDLGF